MHLGVDINHSIHRQVPPVRKRPANELRPVLGNSECPGFSRKIYCALRKECLKAYCIPVENVSCDLEDPLEDSDVKCTDYFYANLI